MDGSSVAADGQHWKKLASSSVAIARTARLFIVFLLPTPGLYCVTGTLHRIVMLNETHVKSR
jgi:hypothetical protein